MALIDNLIAYWELEEASGTRNDSHGTNHLADNNTVTQGTGKVGNAADFELDNAEYLNLADNVALSTGNIDFTIAFWFKPETVSLGVRGNIIGKGDVNGSEYTVNLETNNAIRFDVYGATGFGSGTTLTATNAGTLSAGTWYFIVAWHDATANTINVQVNDGTADSQAHTAGSFDSPGAFFIGGYAAYSQYVDGLVDQVGFWKRVLTAPEKTSLYNSGAGLSYAALSGGGGGTTPITVNTLTDSLAGGEIL